MGFPFYFHRLFSDFDEYCDSARNWDLDFYQLEKGCFTSELLMFGNERVLFTHTRLGRKLKQIGATPPDPRA
jgi:hypothetical protein